VRGFPERARVSDVDGRANRSGFLHDTQRFALDEFGNDG
jgi:hypothetical protein